MGRIRGGQRARFPRTREWNRWEAAGQFFERYWCNARALAQEKIRPRDFPYGIIRVKNNTGGDVEAGDVLGLDSNSPAITTVNDPLPFAFYADQVWGASTPNTASHFGRWCVLLEGLKNTEIGLAVAWGLALAKCDYDGTTSQELADIAQDSTKKAVCWWAGSADVLEVATVSSVNWGLLRLGNYRAPLWKGEVTGTQWTPGTGGNAKIYDDGGTYRATVGVVWSHMDETGANNLVAGKDVWIRWNRNLVQWDLVIGQGMW